jgi:hypothetical protein
MINLSFLKYLHKGSSIERLWRSRDMMILLMTLKKQSVHIVLKINIINIGILKNKNLVFLMIKKKNYMNLIIHIHNILQPINLYI